MEVLYHGGLCCLGIMILLSIFVSLGTGLRHPKTIITATVDEDGPDPQIVFVSIIRTDYIF